MISLRPATLFIEPAAVVTMNNELREQKVKEQREIEKILLRLSSLTAEHEDALSANMEAAARLDLIFAKALLRGDEATLPKMNEQGYIRFRKGRNC